MKTNRRIIFFVFSVVLLSGLVISAQERDTSGTSAASAPVAVQAPSAPQSIPQSSGSSGSYYGGSSNFSSSRDSSYSPMPSGGGSLPISYGSDRFINNRTSFWSYDGYYRSMQLFDFLMFNYGSVFGNRYFSRYYTNNEPILNTKVAFYAMQIPLHNAKQMLAIANRLQEMRGKYAAQSGKGSLLQDADFKSSVQKIRQLAHLIEKYPALEYLEVRKSNNLTEKMDSKDFETCLNQMDSFIRMLQSQFQTIMESESHAMVSVEQLSQPSFISLAKGIEKLAAQLEKSRT